MSDQELLHDYVQNGSEKAFATLVRRHIDFVYSAALRMVVDPHLAEDVTQAVFVAVAKAAPRIQHCSVLSAWLHRTTRNLAAMTVRTEVRRRAREKEAALMNQDSSETKIVWELIAPQLDEALAQLRARDRDALLLRYFEGKTAREIGQRLGLSEEAAQKRLARALGNLREILHDRGVTVTASVLAGLLTVQTIQAAPAALVTSVTATSLTALTSTVTPGLFALMTSTKLTLGVVAIVTSALTTTIIIQHQANGKLRAELAAREAQLLQPEPAKVERTSATDDADELAALRREHSELLRLRGEIGMLRQREQQRMALGAQKQGPVGKATASPPNENFVPSESWKEVGTATPQDAFQSFLAVLKTGDPTRIESAVHWDLRWKDDVTEEDRRLVEKSKQDYLEMFQRARDKLSAFSLAPIPPTDSERTRVFFHMLTAEGVEVPSSFEMMQSNGQWKPVLSMGWRYPKEPDSFFTSPVFGPSIDLEH